MRVAIVHDWLVTYAGGERVLSELISMYPQADLFAVVDFLSDVDRARIGGKRAVTTFIQRLPWAKRKYRSYLPLMPLAIEQFDLSKYDLVISSTHAVAKGVLTGPGQVHVSYVHSPIRYAWDLQHVYLQESNLTHGLKSWLARWLLHRIRIWDSRTASGVDQFVCNSNFIAKRIKKAYGREALVIPPPVAIERLVPRESKEDFYLTASRLVPYKRLDLVVEAFSQMPEKRLVVIGDGPEMEKIRQIAGPNIEILGYQADEVLQDHMARARAFVFAGEEDFGIILVEAQGCGTPVIAYGKGGALEIVRADNSKPTGVFFDDQSTASIRDAVSRYEARIREFSPAECRRNAERFSANKFRADLGAIVSEAMSAARSGNRCTHQ